MQHGKKSALNAVNDSNSLMVKEGQEFHGRLYCSIRFSKCGYGSI